MNIPTKARMLLCINSQHSSTTSTPTFQSSLKSFSSIVNPFASSIPNKQATMKSDPAVVVDVPEASSKGKGPVVTVERGVKGGYSRGISIFDLIVRIAALVAALAAAAIMGTSDQTLPFFTQFFQFQASYDDLPTFQFFVIAMAIVGGYLVLSLPFSIVTIIRPRAVGVRLLLLILDTVALTLNTAAGAAAAAIVYLAHNGNNNTNWLAICQQFGDFCQKVSTAVVASFVCVLGFALLVLISAFAMKRH